MIVPGAAWRAIAVRAMRARARSPGPPSRDGKCRNFQGRLKAARYLGHPNSNSVMDAWFMPEWMPRHRAVRGRSQITSWAVPVEQRHAIE